MAGPAAPAGMPVRDAAPAQRSAWRTITGVLGRVAGVALGLGAMFGVPAITSAHGLSPVYQSPLPLSVYLVGAAVTVALSFLFILARDVRAPEIVDGRLVRVPAVLRVVLRAIGLIGWAWIVAQTLAGGSSASRPPCG
jgi:hypothetical protein